tara:strand:+ start:125 stop:1015 length:891 start_codon:yes stop_codon:yes gene_type:complete
MRKITLYFVLLFSAFFTSNALSEYPTTIDKNSLKVFFNIFDLADYATPPDPSLNEGAVQSWKDWYMDYYRTPFHRSMAYAYPKNNIKSADFSGFCFIPGWNNRSEADAAALDCCKLYKEQSHTCTILFRNNDILDKNYLTVLNPKIPANAYASGTSWKCKSGYKKAGDSCKKKEIPTNAKVSGSGWTCIKGYKKVGSRCNKIYVPANASLSGSGWKCNTGYAKIGSGCQIIPVNASATSSGWKCNTGYTKEGNSCKKIEVSLGYVEELKKIKELLDSGIINEDDFEKMKQKIINSI